MEVYSVHQYIKKKECSKELTFNKYANFRVFKENPVHHDYNESYKIEKEKGIDNLLLSHDKEDVGFKNELEKHKKCKMEIIINFEGSNFTIYCCESETI